MLDDALKTARSQEEECRAYYGPVMSQSPATVIYVASSCKKGGSDDARAGCGIYWGDKSKRNVGASVPGAQSDARAALYAVVLALLNAPESRTLVITSGSQYAIRSFCYWAAGNATRGWPCTNADIIRVGSECLRARPAGVTFNWISREDGVKNTHFKAARALAKAAAAR
ncbi:hypothetical protein B0H15DRAFT_737197, partial [Mycena belliarum]